MSGWYLEISEADMANAVRCGDCGVLVVDQGDHTRFHEMLNESM